MQLSVICLQALYWRLLMNTSGDLEKNVIGSTDLPASSERHYKAAVETSTFLYLYQCYERFVFQSSSPKVCLQSFYCISTDIKQGPVVQSIVRLTSSLRDQFVKCFTTL